MNDSSKNTILLEISDADNKHKYSSRIVSAINQAEQEITELNETIESVKLLKPDCDKLDYTLSACSGALCGIIDIFLVGKPSDSELGNLTDKWFENRTRDFAKICGWEGNDEKPVSSAIRYLEQHFHVPYDQRGCGDAGRIVFDLNPSNHHFKSLGHNPSLLGLVFSVIDQFYNSSHFVTGGDLIILHDADDTFKLQGSNFLSKLWCGFVNWLAHLFSDVSGSSGSIGRGAGIPSPLWTWTNDVIALKRLLHIEASSFDKDILEMAQQLYNEGFDFRFQTTQTIPVIINELLVRLIYLIRRLIKYYSETSRDNFSWKDMWAACKPYSNVTVKRMLTVAHGTFCLVDAGDAAIRGFATGGGSFNAAEFFLRLNVAGVGRFAISLFGETKREINYHKAANKALFAQKELKIVDDYIDGLKQLGEFYNDSEYLSFADDLENGDYKSSFVKTSLLAEHRGVDELQILRSKKDIDSYFNN